MTPLFYSVYLRKITTLHDISKFKEFFIIQFSNIPINSLLQSDLSHFTGSVLTPDLPIISLVSFYSNFKAFYNNIALLSQE